MDGHKFYNDMHKNSPGRWDVVGGWHPFDANVKNVVAALFGTSEISVLDLGCGNGRTLNFIKAPNMTLFGVDYSQEAINQAKVKCMDGLFSVQDMIKTDFKDHVFDAVISVGSFEHQEVLDFSEPRRLVKDDGWFVCVLPDVAESKGLTTAADGLHNDWELTIKDWNSKVEPYGFKFQDYLYPWTFIYRPI